MQVALIIPLSGDNLPSLPGLPSLPERPSFPGQPGQPLPGAPGREELKAAIKAKLEEWVAGLNPPSRDEIRQKLDQIAAELRDKVAGALPPGCIATPK